MLILLKKPDSDTAVSIDPNKVSAIDPHANGKQCIVYVEHRPFNVAGTVEEVTEKINQGRRPQPTGWLTTSAVDIHSGFKRGVKIATFGNDSFEGLEDWKSAVAEGIAKSIDKVMMQDIDQSTRLGE